jgi:16S rRNA (adenine1518-N6/adenine1519-N6)-dimethyltransferase
MATSEDLPTPSLLLQLYRERTKKHLGQHFLADYALLDEIARLARVDWGDAVLEVGPGCGTLTTMLMGLGAEVRAVEIDEDCVDFLRNVLVPQGLDLVEGDFLSFDLGELLADHERWKVVANLPYQIATEVLFRLFVHAGRIDQMVLMFQREVAERLVAEPGDDGFNQLSLMVSLYAQAELVFELEPGVFHPPPRVHSGVVWFRPIEGTRIPDDEVRTAFIELVKTAFQKQRKTFPNAVKSLGYDKARLGELLEELGHHDKLRPAKLSFEEYEAITRALIADERGD